MQKEKITKAEHKLEMKLKLKPGDVVKITKNDGQIVEGTVMPEALSGFLILKLKSGYNIGLEKSNIKGIEKIGTRELERFPEAKIEARARKNIAVILAGGTISSRVDYTTGAVSALMKPENLFFLVPEIAKIANIKIDFAFSALSENLNYKHWQILAKKCEKWLNDESIEGIIITHGTDTLHYSASALSFMLKNINKPVVLTYAQRSSDRPSTDAILNLIASAHVALSDIAEVVLVGHESSNDETCLVIRGTKARKMHSTRRDTFRPINALPLARVSKDGKIEIISEYNKKDPNKKERAKADIAFEKKVALIKFYPNCDPSILDFYAKQGYRGIVIEGTGMGHVCSEGKLSWLEKIKKLSKKILICMTTQTIYGSVNPYVYSTARKLEQAGIVYLHDMLAETAYVKLGYVLGKTKKLDEARALMLQNLAGEFNERELPECFLY